MTSRYRILIFAISLLCPLLIWMYFHQSAEAGPGEGALQSIKPFLKEADIPLDSYFFDDDSLVKIKRPTGTRICIQPGTFIRKDGEPIEGRVELKVREFHTAADLLRAGIPMTVNSGSDELLQSAGMIEMRAYSEGEELEIKDGKSAEVALAGYRSSENYDLYYLNNDSEWITLDNFTEKKNPSMDEFRKNLKPLPPKPMNIDTTEKGDFIFDIAGDFTQAGYLKDLSNRRWKLCKEFEHPDIERAMRINWDRVDVSLKDKERNIYEMRFSNPESFAEPDSNSLYQVVSFRCTPVIDESNARADNSLFESQMQAYRQTVKRMEEERIKEENRIAAEAGMNNYFRANKMGIYNIDCLMKSDELLYTSVNFDFEKSFNPAKEKLELCVVYLSNNSVVKFYPGQWNSVPFTPGKDMMLLALLPNREVAVVDNEQIQEALKKGKGKMSFTTQNYPAKEFFKRSGEFLASGGGKSVPSGSM